MGFSAAMAQASNIRSPPDVRTNGIKGKDPMSPSFVSRTGPTSKGAHASLKSTWTHGMSQQRRVANAKLANLPEAFKSLHVEATVYPYGDASSPLQASTGRVKRWSKVSTTPSSGSVSSTELKALLDQLEEESEATPAGAASRPLTPRPYQLDSEKEEEWFTAQPNLTFSSHRPGVRYCSLSGSLVCPVLVIFARLRALSLKCISHEVCDCPQHAESKSPLRGKRSLWACFPPQDVWGGPLTDTLAVWLVHQVEGGKTGLWDGTNPELGSTLPVILGSFV